MPFWNPAVSLDATANDSGSRSNSRAWACEVTGWELKKHWMENQHGREIDERDGVARRAGDGDRGAEMNNLQEVRRKQREWAIDRLNRWASVLNDGALFYPGPDDMNRTQSVACRITLEDQSAFEFVDSELAACGGGVLKDLLIHVHWKGEPLEAFNPFQPGETRPSWMSSLGLDHRAVCKAAYNGFVKRLIRRGHSIAKIAAMPLTAKKVGEFLRESA